MSDPDTRAHARTERRLGELMGWTRCAVHRCMTGAVLFAVSVPLCAEHVDEMRRHLDAATLDRTSFQAAAPVDAIVYYATSGDHIKIGTTTSPAVRWQKLAWVHKGFHVLVVEPGNRRTDARRHREFEALRLERTELFVPDAPLLAHIDNLRNQWPDWRDLIQRVQDRQGGERTVVRTP